MRFITGADAHQESSAKTPSGVTRPFLVSLGSRGGTPRLCFRRGARGAPARFDAARNGEAPVPVDSIELTGSEVLEEGVVWLRYPARNGKPVC
jgi:hypothetical protein